MKWQKRMGAWVLSATLATLLVAAGCKSSNGVDDPDGGHQLNNNNHAWPSDSTVPGPDSSQPDAATGDCDRNSYTPVTQLATYSNGTNGSFLHYQAYDSEGYPVNRVSVQVYSSFGGPSTPGTYTLEGGPDANYETCGLCPLIYIYSSAGDPEKVFYADTGNVEITSIGTIGGTFAATFHNLIFREVTIDASFHSTLVPNGETWCLNGYSFTQSILDESTVCPMPGTCIGDDIGDFQVVSCETGNTVNLLTHSTATSALWIVGSHEW